MLIDIKVKKSIPMSDQNSHLPALDEYIFGKFIAEELKTNSVLIVYCYHIEKS